MSSFAPDSPLPFPSRAPRRSTETGRSYSQAVSDYGVAIEDCDDKDGKVTCTASATIPPRQRVRFSNATLRHNPGELVRFKISFFGRTAPPANANAYVQLGTERGKIPSQFAVGLGIDGASAYDLSSGFRGHNRHTSGTGTASIEFAGGIVDASVALGFKSGDFGGPDSTRNVTLGEYQAKVFGSRGQREDLKPIVLQYGQFLFARPTSGIAISEKGEGLLLAYQKLAASYILHRESDQPDGKANTQNDDYYVTMLQMNNLPLRGVRQVDGIDLIAVYGNNKADDRPAATPAAPDPKRQSAYTFTTLGSELRMSFRRIPNSSMSVGLYHSQRQIRPRREESEEIVKGRGTVGLLTFGWQWSGSKTLFETGGKSRPSFGPTFTIGRGTGDDPLTTDRDEGFLGETAGFANDKIFLSQLAADDELSKKIGQGLENKWYLGAQWNDARGSLLGWIARKIGDSKNIESATTNASIHTYRFVHPLEGRHWGGVEGNIEFLLESPTSVTWSLGGAYYHRSHAVELTGIADDLWQITAGVSVKLQGN